MINASHAEAVGNVVVSCLGEPDYYSTIPFRGPEGGGWSIVLWYPEKGMALEGFFSKENIDGDRVTISITYFFKPSGIDEIVQNQVLIVPQWAGQPLEDILPYIKPWPGDLSKIQ